MFPIPIAWLFWIGMITPSQLAFQFLLDEVDCRCDLQVFLSWD